MDSGAIVMSVSESKYLPSQKKITIFELKDGTPEFFSE